MEKYGDKDKNNKDNYLLFESKFEIIIYITTLKDKDSSGDEIAYIYSSRKGNFVKSN